MKRFVLALVLVLPLGGMAAGSEPEAAPPPPPIPDPRPPVQAAPDEDMEADVVIRHEEDRMVEEYRRGGRLYMVRITPHWGPPYYLIDTTGDGDLDFRHDHMNPVKPAHWRLIEW